MLDKEQKYCIINRHDNSLIQTKAGRQKPSQKSPRATS